MNNRTYNKLLLNDYLQVKAYALVSPRFNNYMKTKIKNKLVLMLCKEFLLIEYLRYKIFKTKVHPFSPITRQISESIHEH